MSAQAYQEAEYELLKKDGHVQIRLYKKAYLAKYHSQGNKKTAGNSAFMPLFNYIREGDIPMTVPVIQEEVKANEWDMSFFMPSEKSIKDLAKPSDSKVKVVEFKARKMIVYKFTGSMNDRNFEKFNPRLIEYVKHNNLVIKKQPVLASYNSPFTPWFMRRSEIMYELL